MTCPSCGCSASMDRHPNHGVGCTLSHLTGKAIELWARMDAEKDDPLGPQHPCPCCERPMDGVGWRVRPHDCDVEPQQCPTEHVEFWIGPWGDCPNCTTQEVVMAALKLNVPQGIIVWPGDGSDLKGLSGASG